MTDPTVSNVRVTARPIDGPREGLPPCLSLVLFDGRGASLFDDAAGCHSSYGRERFWVGAGTIGTERVTTSRRHPGYPSWPVLEWVIALETDDPDEAQAAFERGAEWVRTGQIA